MTCYIHIQDDKELDVGGEEGNKIEVKNTIYSYKQKKNEKLNIKMKIIIRTHENDMWARRFPIADRDTIDEQVEEPLKQSIMATSASEYSRPVVARKNNGSSTIFIDIDSMINQIKNFQILDAEIRTIKEVFKEKSTEKCLQRNDKDAKMQEEIRSNFYASREELRRINPKSTRRKLENVQSTKNKSKEIPCQRPNRGNSNDGRYKT